MKVQFRRDKRGEILMSDTFNWDYNPYRVGDMINICGIKRASTKHVDLELHPKWYYKIGYFILSCCYLKW